MPLLAQEAGRTLAESRLELGASLSDRGSSPACCWCRCSPGPRASGGVPCRRAPLPEADLPRTWRIRWAWVPSPSRSSPWVCSSPSRVPCGEISLTKENEGVDIVLPDLDLHGAAPGTARRRRRRGQARRAGLRRAPHDRPRGRLRQRVPGRLRDVHRALCPFTLDADAVTGVLAEQRRCAATSTGRASGWGCPRPCGSSRTARTVKVVVVLTDGEETTGLIDPLDAARLASGGACGSTRSSRGRVRSPGSIP